MAPWKPDTAMIARVEEMKTRIGWSWNELATRVGMNFQSMTLFRNGKRPLDPRWVDYLEAIDYAISTVAVPVIERVVIEPPAPPPVPPLPAVALPEPVGNGLFADAPDNNVTRIRVMTIDDIAAKLAAEYVDIANEPDINGTELATARWMISRLAEKLGIVDEVKERIGATKATSKTAGLVPRAAPPASPRVGIPPALPASDREEWQPPQPRDRAGSFADETL